MKKTILLSLLLIIIICFAGCNKAPEGTTDGTTTEAQIKDIWAGVEGDTVELKANYEGAEISVVLNSDGTACYYSLAQAYTTAADMGFEQYDAEIAIHCYWYGTYKQEGNIITVTANLTQYLRATLRGKDAEAFKKAYSDYLKADGQSQELVDSIFTEGAPRSKTEDVGELVCAYNGESLDLQAIKTYKNGKYLESVIECVNGLSAKSIVYFENGKIYQEEIYSSDGRTEKRTYYNEDGTLDSVYTNVIDANGRQTQLVVDAEGKEISKVESWTENYSGGVKRHTKMTKNGEVEYQIEDEREDGIRVTINETTYYDGNKDYSMTVVDENFDQIYSLYEHYIGEKLDVYSCRRNYKDADIIEMEVLYTSDSGDYRYRTVMKDNSVKEEKVSASQYVKQDWETYN